MLVPHISDSEWEVIRILWQTNSPMTAAMIIENIQGSKSWKPKTVKTLISRLVKKQVLGCNKDNREYMYFPLFSEDECIKTESSTFLNRIFGGSLKPMMIHFLENEKLSAEDIRELKALLEDKEK